MENVRKLIHQDSMKAALRESGSQLVDALATQMRRDFCVSPEGVMLHPKCFSNDIIMSQRQPRLDNRFRGIHS